MKTVNLLVKSKHSELYLVVGYTSDITTPPTAWQLPVIPNEYGNANLGDVIKKRLLQDFGLTVTSISDSQPNNHIIAVEVNESSIEQPAKIVDGEEPSYTIELRGFVAKDQLKAYINLQDAVLADFTY